MQPCISDRFYVAFSGFKLFLEHLRYSLQTCFCTGEPSFVPGDNQQQSQQPAVTVQNLSHHHARARQQPGAVTRKLTPTGRRMYVNRRARGRQKSENQDDIPCDHAVFGVSTATSTHTYIHK